MGTSVESGHVILEFNISQAQVTEQSQISILDFKRADSNKLRKKLVQDAWETEKR